MYTGDVKDGQQSDLYVSIHTVTDVMFICLSHVCLLVTSLSGFLREILQPKCNIVHEC